MLLQMRRAGESCALTDIDPLGVEGLFKEGSVVELIQILHDVQGRTAA